MSRVIQTGDTAAKRRRAHLRSVAEALRLLATRPEVGAGRFDAEAQDVAAFVVFALRGIGETIEASAQAWDDRGYWKKSEALRAEWRWAPRTAEALQAAVLAGRWAAVPPLLLDLLPHVQDVTVAQAQRDADWGCGALRALQKEGGARGA